MLTIERASVGIGVNLWKISGLTDAELDELNRMPWSDMKNRVVDILDERENSMGMSRIGTRWHNGYGLYNVYIRGKDVYAEVGNTCD